MLNRMKKNIKNFLKLNKRKLFMGGYCLFSIFIILCITLPVIWSSSYSVLSGDDYSHGVHIESFHVPFFDYLMASLSYMKKEYLTWQGTYFSMFLQAFLSPINNFGMPQLRVVMVINSIMFFSSILFLIWAVMGSIFKKDYLIEFFAVCTAVIYYITAYKIYVEVFYQFSCAVSYTYPLAFLLFALGLLIKYNVSGKKSIVVCSGILGFLAVGGSLTIAGFGCYVCLLICIFGIMGNNKQYMNSNIIIFLSWISGAIINTVAPGNYVRHAQIDSTGLHLKSALKTAFVGYGKRLDYFFSETNFIFVFLILIFVGIVITKERHLNIKRYLVMSILFLFSPAVAGFPLALGYSNFIYANFPDRVVFILDISLILSYTNIAVCLGILIGNKFQKNKEMRCAFVYMLFLLMLVDMGADGFSPTDFAFLRIEHKIRNKTYQNYYIECLCFYDYLDTFEGGDVIIDGNQFPQPIEDFMCLSLSDDPEDYVNIAVSKYYGFDSLVIQSEKSN